MAKFLNVLAASVGGGLVLGASIRLGEAIGSSSTASHGRGLPLAPSNGTNWTSQTHVSQAHSSQAHTSQTHTSQTHASSDPLIAARLERLEEKLTRLDSERFAGPGPSPAPANAELTVEWQTALERIVARMELQHAEVETVRHEVSKATSTMESMSAMAENLRHELHRTISQDMDRRLKAIEEEFQASMEAANRETVDAMVASIETRIAPRIGRLETDLAGQKSAVSELRECALQSERSIHRLLGVLEKVLKPQGPATDFESRAGETTAAAARSKGADEARGGGEVRRAS